MRRATLRTKLRQCALAGVNPASRGEGDAPLRSPNAIHGTCDSGSEVTSGCLAAGSSELSPRPYLGHHGATMSVHASYCPLDCPDRCSLDVTVEDGRVVAIEGSRANPLTEGFICSKVRRFHERVYGPDRLLHPMVRTGAKGEGRFAPVAWPEAVALVARRLGEVRERWGGEAILPYYYGGSNGLVTQGTLDARFFASLGASRLDRAVCAAPTGTVAKAMTGKMPGVAFPDYDAARLIVLWGANPWHSNIHLVPHLK